MGRYRIRVATGAWLFSGSHNRVQLWLVGARGEAELELQLRPARGEVSLGSEESGGSGGSGGSGDPGPGRAGLAAEGREAGGEVTARPRGLGLPRSWDAWGKIRDRVRSWDPGLGSTPSPFPAPGPGSLQFLLPLTQSQSKCKARGQT